MLTDPIGDMIARIRNAGQARHHEVSIPHSKLKLALARVLEQEGYLGPVRVESREGHAVIVAELRYDADGSFLIDGMRRTSKPSRRVYVSVRDIPRVRDGLGVAVLSTSRGILCDRDARAQSVGGEILCEVW